MIKYALSLLLLLTVLDAAAQKKSVVNLIQSDRSESVKINGRDVVKVYKGVFQQDFSIMHSDSAYLYAQDNAFDAFGHVNITQGDTLNIYSDKLNYNGNTKVAVLTDNVRLVDKDATLTTNFLTYNTATRIGTYTGGGKLVNKDNTLTSKNGYYFAFSRDAYFRYNVVLVTPDALVKTDTMRYNSGTRISYFYGPTNIYDTKDKKDTLYTENGLYNTVTEQAFFGKKNLYKQGTKTLKGDSLFYDKLKGYGRAVKHVTFHDREQNVTLKGDLATYYKAQERTVVTQDPYVIVVSEQKDTTGTDTVAKQTVNTTATNSAVTVAKAPSGKKLAPPVNSVPVKQAKGAMLVGDTTATVKPVEKVKRDSIYISADTLETQMITFKDLTQMQEQQRLASVRDTARKDTAAKAKAPKLSAKEAALQAKLLTLNHPQVIPNSDRGHKDMFGPPVAPPAATTKPIAQRKGERPAEEEEDVDPVFRVKAVVLADTARIRIIKAYHHAKLFKSDLQAKADSMFYAYSDSTLHCFVEPIIWAQGSQITGDTITMQMKNKKLNNLYTFPRSFIVNLEKTDSSHTDSTHFNQMSGKRLKGFFKNDKLDQLYVGGNAESIYFSRDSLKNVDGMQRSLSSKLRIDFKNGEASGLHFTTKPEHRYGPLSKFTEDEKILKGFIWKPKERPVSKESILPSYGRKNNLPGAKPTVTANKGKATNGKANSKAAPSAPPTNKGQNSPTASPADSATTTLAAKADTVKLTPAANVKSDTTAKKQ